MLAVAMTSPHTSTDCCYLAQIGDLSDLQTYCWSKLCSNIPKAYSSDIGEKANKRLKKSSIDAQDTGICEYIYMYSNFKVWMVSEI